MSFLRRCAPAPVRQDYSGLGPPITSNADHFHAGYLDGQSDYRAALAGKPGALGQAHDFLNGSVAPAFRANADRLGADTAESASTPPPSAPSQTTNDGV
jgi:hypothetical protein